MSWIREHVCEAPVFVDALELETLERGRLHRLAVAIGEDAIGRTVRVPAIVVRGARPGPVAGIVAALHGNELNGTVTIHRLIERIDPAALAGTVVAVPIANVPGYLAQQRRFTDGQDLNHIMPGRADGNEGQVYAFRLVERIVRQFEVLLDLHTASFGRVNSLYVRVDMRDARAARLARLIGAEIIVHNAGKDGTLRAAAAERGITAVTVEIGDPQIVDPLKVRATRIGLRDVLEDLAMLPADEERADPETAVVCARSYWLYTDTGGFLTVLPALCERVRAGQPIAQLVDPWGQPYRTYHAPEDGIVIGMSSNPTAPTGARILHLGIVGDPPR